MGKRYEGNQMCLLSVSVRSNIIACWSIAITIHITQHKLVRVYYAAHVQGIMLLTLIWSGSTTMGGIEDGSRSSCFSRFLM